jgi:hypothetical protein
VSKANATVPERKLGPRPATKDHLTSGKKPLTVKHQVVRDNEVADRLVEARNAYELEEARFKAKPTDKERQASFEAAEAAYREAQAEAEEYVVEVTLRGMGRHRFDLLKRAHPPTELDIADAERVGIEAKQLDFSTETFPPACIAATMIDPETGEPMMTEKEVRTLIWESDEWNDAEAQSLFLAALKANQARSSVDLGKAFGGTPASASSKPSATASENPAASS